MIIIRAVLVCVVIMALLDITCAKLKFKKKLWLLRKLKKMDNKHQHHHYHIYHHLYHPDNKIHEKAPNQGNKVNHQEEVGKGFLNINQHPEKYLASINIPKAENTKTDYEDTKNDYKNIEELDKFVGSTEKVFVETDYYKYNISQAVNNEDEKHKNEKYKLGYNNVQENHENQNNEHVSERPTPETPSSWHPIVYDGNKIKYTNTNFGNTAALSNENNAQHENKFETYAVTTAKVFVETDNYKYNISQKFTDDISDNSKHESGLNKLDYTNNKDSEDNQNQDQAQEMHTSETPFVWVPIVNENKIKYIDTNIGKSEEQGINKAQHQSELENYDGTTAKVYVETDDYKYNISEKVEDNIADNKKHEPEHSTLDYNNGQESTDNQNQYYLLEDTPKIQPVNYGFNEIKFANLYFENSDQEGNKNNVENKDKLQQYVVNTEKSFVETDNFKYNVDQEFTKNIDSDKQEPELYKFDNNGHDSDDNKDTYYLPEKTTSKTTIVIIPVILSNEIKHNNSINLNNKINKEHAYEINKKNEDSDEAYAVTTEKVFVETDLFKYNIQQDNSNNNNGNEKREQEYYKFDHNIDQESKKIQIDNYKPENHNSANHFFIQSDINNDNIFDKNNDFNQNLGEQNTDKSNVKKIVIIRGPI